jgi:hypothetical protein
MINRQGVMGAWVVLSLMFGSAHAAPEKVAPTKSSLPSARETVEATADGSGATPAAALTRALANAVQQVTGVATKQLGDVETSLNTLAVVKSNGDIAVANWAAESTGNTLSFSRGSVKSYRVLSEQAVGKGWRVRVRAAVLKAGGADAVREAMPRLAIVVTQAQAADVAFANLGNRNTVIKRFRARLQQSLLQSGAVRVLDRDNFSAQADELSIAGANPTAENLAKLGQRFSADYVVVIDAQRLRLIDRGRDIYGAHLSKLEAELQADIRIIDVATSELMKTSETARSAIQIASEGAQVVAQLAEDGAKVAAQIAGDTAKAASQIAKEVALQMAQAYLRKSTLTLALPESLLNKQVRLMAQRNPSVDHVAVYCGDDRLTVAIDGHQNRLVYTVELEFDVLECRISRDEQYLRVRQVDESLDAQFRQTNLVTNWATRQIARGSFFMANRLPTRSPVNQMLEDLSGFRREGPRLWRIDLQKSDLIELLNNRAWMVDKLLSLSDLSVLPGLTTLKDSRDLLMQLVNQFEIRDLRVRPGRLEVLVGINAG